MKTFTLNGIQFYNFGSNSQTNGMELITATHNRDEIVEMVLKGELHGVWLNPSAEGSKNEFFGLFGTADQYEEVYARQKECQISKDTIEALGGINAMMNATEEEIRTAEESVKAFYTDWWMKK